MQETKPTEELMIDADDLLERSSEYLSNALKSMGDGNIAAANMASAFSIAAALMAITKQLEEISHGLDNLTAVCEK